MVDKAIDEEAIKYQLEKVDQGGDIQELFEAQEEKVAEAFGLELGAEECPYPGTIKLPDGRYVGLEFHVVFYDSLEDK